MLEDAESKGLLNASQQCVDRLRDIANNFQSNAMLIAQMVYNSGKDVNDLGKFVACTESPTTRYVVFSVTGLPLGIYLGICGPIECTEDDYNTLRPYLSDIGNQVLEYLNIDQAFFKEGLTPERLGFYDSEVRNEEVRTLGVGHYITIGFVSFLVLSIIISTIVEIIERSKTAARKKLGLPDEEEPRKKTCLQKYFKSFYLIENTSKLLFARSKDGDKNLEILNGIRVLSMFWVILGHTYFYAMQSALANPLIPLTLFRMFSFNLVSAGPYAVDIFFWLSGFLGVYILLGTTKKKNGKMQNPLMIYLHRYLRLIPMYVLTLLFYWFVMSSVGTGPIYFKYYEGGARICRETWWIHLLFLNNIAEIHPRANECMGWTWYLPNDMQFFLLIPLLVFLLYRKRTFGLIFIGVFQAICFAVTIALAYVDNMSPSYFEANDRYYKFYYHRPWARIAPFFVGVIVAVLLYSFNNETPEESRLKRIMDKLDQSKAFRIVLYILGTAIFWTMIFIFYPINNYPESFGQFFNVMFLTFSKAIFVIGMSMILLPCLMGHNSLMRRVLSFDAFTPLARLTFGAYMVHPTFMLFDAFNTVRGEYLTINFGITRYLAWLIAAFGTSMVCTLLVETPFMNLEKFFLMGGGKAKRSSSQGQLLEKTNKHMEPLSNGRYIDISQIGKYTSINSDDFDEASNEVTRDDTPNYIRDEK